MENTRMDLGARAPVLSILEKMLFENLKKVKYFFHVHIMLIFTCVCFHEKMRLYLVYTKMI
jgi:hypothetical protein